MDFIQARRPPSSDLASDGSPEMAGEPRTLSFPDWYRALVDEDSVKVMELLQGAPELLKEGWKENPREQLDGWIIMEDRRWGIERSGPRPWMGRTALHVASRRGCSKLVEEIMDMFDDQGILKNFSSIDVYGRLSRSKKFTLAELLGEVDPLYKLDALAMAVVNGSPDIVKSLKKASLRCLTNPYHVSREAEEQNSANFAMDTPAALAANRSEEDVIQLRKLIEHVMNEFSKSKSTSVRILRKLYAAHIDFNYLPWEEFFFHFTFDFELFGVKVDEYIQATQETKDEVEQVAQLIRRRIAERALNIPRPNSETSLLGFLFKLQDGQGRTPLHVAIDGRTAESFITLIIPEGLEYSFCLNVPDGAGRTPLYRAAAEGDTETVEWFLEDPRTNLNGTFRLRENPRLRNLHLGKLLEKNGFKSLSEGPEQYVSTALHIAIIHRHLSVVTGLLHDQKSKARTEDSILDPSRLSRCSRQFSIPPADPIGPGTRFHRFGPISLAILAKNLPILQQLVKDKRVPDKGRRGSSSEYWNDETCMPGLHLAAALANPGFVQVFLDNEDFDPLALDELNNTALHHAVAGRHVPFALHLIDFVGCKHFLQNIQSKSPYDVEDVPNRLHMSAGEGQEAGRSGQNSYGRRQGCINMLLQAGVDAGKKNRDGDTARPGPEAHESFVTWWYEKVAKETSESRTNLNAAANAISVTAALVATASYVGPLQPPLGYGGGNSDDQSTLKVQVTILLVRIFIVCDTLSFYLAVASIIFALIPALPMQQESMFGELRRSRRTVALAAGSLFPSIISVLIAFAAGSLAVIPNQGSWNAGGLTLITAVLGGLVCLVAIVLFCVRFLRYLFYKSSTISRFYKATTF